MAEAPKWPREQPPPAEEKKRQGRAGRVVLVQVEVLAWWGWLVVGGLVGYVVGRLR